MSNKTMGIVGMILGALIVVSNVIVGITGWPWLAMQFGFPSSGFGWRKITLIIIGVLFLIIGALLYIARKKENKV